MDVPTLLLVYTLVRHDFKGLFSIRRLFCLGLLVGVSVMMGIADIFEQINPDKLPIDIIEENEEYHTILYKIQLQNFKKKVCYNFKVYICRKGFPSLA